MHEIYPVREMQQYITNQYTNFAPVRRSLSNESTILLECEPLGKSIKIHCIKFTQFGNRSQYITNQYMKFTQFGRFNVKILVMSGKCRENKKVTTKKPLL